MVGTVVNTYLGYRNINLKMIGSGGFGKVYEFPDQRAVKEEFKVHILCLLHVVIYIHSYVYINTYLATCIFIHT